MKIAPLIGILIVAIGITAEAAVVYGPVTNAANGHVYYLLGEDTWQNAESEAITLGGHLATIRNQSEQDWVFSTFGSVEGVVRSLWIGLREVGSEGNYQWASGEPLTYVSWNSGEPNNYRGVESYVHMIRAGTPYGVAGLWNDIDSPLGNWLYFNPIHGVVEIFPCLPRRARATAFLVNDSIAMATITDSGCGYTNSPLVLIQGGGGSGATATAIITDGRVTGITIISAGCCYTNEPRIVIASPPFVPTLTISVSRVKVVQNVVLGRNYVLESSEDAAMWNPALPPFTATSETITNEFDTELTGRFFRIRQTP